MIEDQSFIEFQTKDKIIQFALYKGNNYLGSCEYNLNKETRWLSISNAITGPKQDGLLYNLTDCIRLRIKCSMNDSTSYSQNKVLVHKINKKCLKTRKQKDSIELSLNHNSTYFTKKERMNKQAVSHIVNNKSKKKDSSQPIVTKLRNNKTCEDGFDNNNSALILSDIPFDSLNKKNGSFHNLKNTRSSHSNHSNNNYHNNFIKSTSTCHRNNNPLKSPSLSRKINTNSIQTTIINNRNNSYENVSRYPQSYITHQSITSKLDDRFKTFEDSIIDKNYENNIKNDEMIQIKDNQKFLEKMINENSEEYTIKETPVLDFDKELYNEEDSKSIFNSTREDFEIFYTQDYIKVISDDTIKLELQLVIDKLCELQNAYHKELLSGLNNYTMYKEIFAYYSEKYLAFHKKYLNLKHEQERAHLTNTLNTFISNHKLKHNNEIIRVNKIEVALWNQLPIYSPYVKAKSAIKDSDSSFKQRLIPIFNEVTKKNKVDLSHHERKLCEGAYNKHSRTRSMEEPEFNHTMPTIIPDTRNGNSVKAEAKCPGTIKSLGNSHNKLVTSSEIVYKKKESKFNKGDKYNRPSIKGYIINKK